MVCSEIARAAVRGAAFAAPFPGAAWLASDITWGRVSVLTPICAALIDLPERSSIGWESAVAKNAA